MGLTRITAPALALVSTADLRAHCRVDHTDDDALLESLLLAATAHLDGYTGVLGMCLAEQVWELSYDAFPCGPIKLPLGPVISVESVIYTDDAGAVLVMDSADYEVDTTGGDGWVSPVDGWPATGSFLNAAKVQFKAGHALIGDIPGALIVAAKMLVGHWYENREGQGETPPAVQALITPFRRIWM